MHLPVGLQAEHPLHGRIFWWRRYMVVLVPPDSSMPAAKARAAASELPPARGLQANMIGGPDTMSPPVAVSGRPINPFLVFVKSGPDKPVLVFRLHLPFPKIGQGVTQLGNGLLLYKGLHGLSLVELEVKTYLLTHTSACFAKIQDNLSGHVLLVFPNACENR
jgi:hypothetical protein